MEATELFCSKMLTFMSRINFMLSCVEHEKSFIISGPGQRIKNVLQSNLLFITETDLLTKWYIRDNNAIPPHYRLKYHSTKGK